MSFKNNLRNELSYQDMKVKKLAMLTHIPYTTLLSYVNYSNTLPNCEIAVKIASKLNVSVEYLVTGNDKELNRIRNKKIENMFGELTPVINEMVQLSPASFDMIKKLIHDLLKIEIKLKE